jgi:biopolymer transport protein ExbD
MKAEAMRSLAFPKKRKSLKLFSDFNNLQFACVMSLVVFVLLLLFMTETRPHHGGVSVDLPKASHPVSMPGADREDAMKITITRDGKVFFRADQVDPSHLSQKIIDYLKDRSVERRVYIVADTRSRWGGVKQVLDGVRNAGVLRVAFLTNQRRVDAFPT